uniref:Fibrinogen C-terminal domain-containing protein n=1 Tax=Anopheles quadriannulatus TaxID=34691 RepID=A0A182WS09_ANOQN
MAKLQILEHHLVESNLQTEEKITILNSRINNLVTAVENLAWIAQQTGETVHQLGLSARHIAHNLTVIQRDLTNVAAEQKLLVTNNQLRQYQLFQSSCNASNGTINFEDHRNVYKSCNKVPFTASVTSMENIYVEKRKNMLLAWDGLLSEDIIML